MQGGYVSPGPAGGGGAPGPGSVGSGALLSGSVAWPHLSSGAVRSGHIANTAVNSGNVSSGALGWPLIADAGVLSGNVASGAVAKQHTASGLLQGTIQFVIDGGGTALASGEKGDVIVPYDCKINYVNLFSDQSGGSVFVGIWKDTVANYPPTSGDTICTSGVPLISGAIRNISYSGTAALSGWTTSLSKGDVLKFVVHSGLTMTRCTIAMQVGVGD